MDKKYSLGLLAVLIIFVALGVFLAFGNSEIPESSDLTDLFDYSSEPITEWDEDKKEFSFSQTVSSVDGKDYNDVDIIVELYKENKNIDNYTSHIKSTKDGKFNIKFTTKLSEEPDALYYNVINATEV